VCIVSSCVNPDDFVTCVLANTDNVQHVLGEIRRVLTERDEQVGEKLEELGNRLQEYRKGVGASETVLFGDVPMENV
jgi:hypothetical protein